MADRAFVQGVLDRLTYKPGWRFEYELWEGSGRPECLAVYRDEPDSRADATKPHFGRRIPIDWPIGTATSEQGVVAWVRHALHEWESHELNEWLRLDGELVHDPHVCDQCLIGGCRG